MKTILVIDDTPYMARMLQEMVQLAGYETAVAHDGPSGIARAADRLPDLVLVDLMMPEMDGWQVADRLRALAPLPIIFVTAADNRENRARAAAMGATLIGKELDPRTLATHIERALAEGNGDSLPSRRRPPGRGADGHRPPAKRRPAEDER